MAAKKNPKTAGKAAKKPTTPEATATPVTPAPTTWVVRDAELKILGRVQAGTEKEALKEARLQFGKDVQVEPDAPATEPEPALADVPEATEVPAPENEQPASIEVPPAEAPVAEPTPATPAEAATPTEIPELIPTPTPSDLPAPQADDRPAETATEQPAGQPPAKPRPARERKPKDPGKLSAIDAAAKVLAETGQPMTCKELIAAMADKQLWTSPGGKTPDATLYSAILREITTKGDAARFVKTDRGKFAARSTV
jgi:hypothetical protein